MQIHVGEEPFRVWLRREEGYDGLMTIRFEIEHGMAVLSLRVEGREEPPPMSHWEEEHIPVDILRAGRFVHVLPGGNRRSYTLQRITPERVGQLPGDRWVELEPLTDTGFRYLVFPRDLPLEPDQATDEKPAAAPARPAAVAKAEVDPRSSAVRQSERGSRPPRQTPMAPELAHEALSQLSHQAAIQHLKMEMAKVEALHQRVDELERRLSTSQEREQDLLAILQKWQAMT